MKLQCVGGNSATVELDYKGIHIVLLYAKKGIPYSGDPYLPAGVDYGALQPKYRKFFKKLLLICINCRNRGQAIKAIRNEVRQEPDDYPAGIDIKASVVQFEQLHAAIYEDFFYSSQGNQLMFIDSEIASRVIQRMVAQGKPVLCVHDSFICKVEDQQLLQDMMVEEFRNELAIRNLVDNTPGIDMRQFIEATLSEISVVPPNPRDVFGTADPAPWERRMNWRETRTQGYLIHTPVGSVDRT